MNALLQIQIALSTAEDEQNYFTGPTSPGRAPSAPHQHAAGTYRVVDGQLYLVVAGAPPIPPAGASHAIPVLAPANAGSPTPTGDR